MNTSDWEVRETLLGADILVKSAGQEETSWANMNRESGSSTGGATARLAEGKTWVIKEQKACVAGVYRTMVRTGQYQGDQMAHISQATESESHIWPDGKLLEVFR